MSAFWIGVFEMLGGIYLLGAMCMLWYMRGADNPLKLSVLWPLVLLAMLFGNVQ